MKAHQIEVRRTANYYTLGEPNVEEWWILIHGYAQTGEEMLEACKPLQRDDRYLIAPEGLSKFYRDGFYGDIGASWMTKHSRETEIEDYVNYLNQLFNNLKDIASPKRLRVMGFSQGASTTSRWLNQLEDEVEDYIIFAGTPAAEMSIEELQDTANNLTLIYGDKDPFLKDNQAENMIKKMRGEGLVIDSIVFDGKHRIVPKALDLIEDHLAKKPLV